MADIVKKSKETETPVLTLIFPVEIIEMEEVISSKDCPNEHQKQSN